ncbi:MauE/DoxX family redox-associated membrane protein [Chryseobacterium sp. R2ACT005]|uniref:MauE/DoxX family redox-associated membrane protein n=1 Tax=Chryseobacterium sp. R2ACT005 TaxID=3416668 RepID=UPI003CF13878
MKSNRITPIEIIRYLLILLYVYTCYHKIVDRDVFEQTLSKSKLIYNYKEILLYLIPLSEIIAIALLIPNKFIKGLYFSLFLMVSFTIYLIAVNNFSLYDGCSCGGIFNSMPYWLHVSVNAFFITINIYAIIKYEDK